MLYVKYSQLKKESEVAHMQLKNGENKTQCFISSTKTNKEIIGYS